MFFTDILFPFKFTVLLECIIDQTDQAYSKKIKQEKKVMFTVHIKCKFSKLLFKVSGCMCAYPVKSQKS